MVAREENTSMSTTEPNGQHEPTPNTGETDIPREESADPAYTTDAERPVAREEPPVETTAVDEPVYTAEPPRVVETPVEETRVEDASREPAYVDDNREPAYDSTPASVAREERADDIYNERVAHEDVRPVDERVDDVRVETVDETDYVAPREDPIVTTPNDAYPAPIYVQAPTPPINKGNRGFGILVGVIATVVFAIVYALVALVVASILNPADAMHAFLTFLPQYVYWVPVVGFFVAFAIVAAIINRAGWWSWVLGGFFVGVFVYFTYIGASLLSAQAWTMTPEEAVRFLGTQWTFPLALGAAITAREVPIWFGAWISSRGRKVSERNFAARRDYDRQLAEGPVITRP